MRIKSIIPVLVIMLAPFFGFAQSDLHGSWLINYETENGPIEILLELMESGEHQVDLGNDGTADIKGVWTAEGGQVTIVDKEGEAACQDDKGGVFTYQVEGDQLTLTTINDPCERGGPEGLMVFTRKN